MVASDPDHQPEFCDTLVGELGSHSAGLGSGSSGPDDTLVMAVLEHFLHGSQGWEYIHEGAGTYLVNEEK